MVEAMVLTRLTVPEEYGGNQVSELPGAIIVCRDEKVRQTPGRTLTKCVFQGGSCNGIPTS